MKHLIERQRAIQQDINSANFRLLELADQVCGAPPSELRKDAAEVASSSTYMGQLLEEQERGLDALRKLHETINWLESQLNIEIKNATAVGQGKALY